MANQATLMERARMALAGGVAVGLVIAPLSSAVAGSTPQLMLLETYVGFGSGGAYTGPQNVNGVVSVAGNSVKLFGHAGPGSGTIWNPAFPAFNLPLLFQAAGDNLAPPQDGDFLHLAYDVDIHFTGGNVEWLIQASQRVNYVGPGVTSIQANASGLLATPGAFDIQGSAASTPLDLQGNTADTTGNSWHTGLWVWWTDFAPSDTITISIPSNSIDLFYNVPEPSGALMGVVGIAISGSLRTRRRTVDSTRELSS